MLVILEGIFFLIFILVIWSIYSYYYYFLVEKYRYRKVNFNLYNKLVVSRVEVCIYVF